MNDKIKPPFVEKLSLVWLGFAVRIICQNVTENNHHK